MKALRILALLFPLAAGAQTVKLTALPRCTTTCTDSALALTTDSATPRVSRAITFGQLRKALSAGTFDSLRTAVSLRFTGTNGRVVGTSNGVSLRNNADNRDNFLVTDAGTSATLTDGTNSATMLPSVAAGERPAGALFTGAATTSATLISGTSGTAGQKAAIAYWNGSNWGTAFEVANVATSFGTNLFLRSGGQHVFGRGGTAYVGAVGITGGTRDSASSGRAIGFAHVDSLVAKAAGDTLLGVRIAPVYSANSNTGLSTWGLDIGAYTVAGTSPADAFGINIGVITGTGATNAAAINLGAGPTGATNNYLIKATNFTLTSAGAGAFSGAVSGTNITAGATNTIKWNGQMNMLSPADAQLKLTNNANTAGIGFDVSTDSTVQIRGRGFAGDGNLSARKLISSDTIRGPTITTITAGSGTHPLVLSTGGSDTVRTSAKMKLTGLTAEGSTQSVLCVTAGGGEVFINAAATCTVSSARFKRDIRPLSLFDAKTMTQALRAVQYTERQNGRRAIGVVAEQADSVDHRLASRDGRGVITSTNYEQVTVALLKVVQDLQARVDSLEARVVRLERPVRRKQ